MELDKGYVFPVSVNVKVSSGQELADLEEFIDNYQPDTKVDREVIQKKIEEKIKPDEPEKPDKPEKPKNSEKPEKPKESDATDVSKSKGRIRIDKAVKLVHDGIAVEDAIKMIWGDNTKVGRLAYLIKIQVDKENKVEKKPISASAISQRKTIFKQNYPDDLIESVIYFIDSFKGKEGGFTITDLENARLSSDRSNNDMIFNDLRKEDCHLKSHIEEKLEVNLMRSEKEGLRSIVVVPHEG